MLRIISASRVTGSPAVCRAATSDATIAPALLPATLGNR